MQDVFTVIKQQIVISKPNVFSFMPETLRSYQELTIILQCQLKKLNGEFTAYCSLP